MKKALLVFVVIFVFISRFQAQNTSPPIPLIKSDSVINLGMKYYDDKEYNKAIAEYTLVPRSDTNYPWALYEIALTYYAKESYDTTLDLCKKGIKLPGQKSRFYSLLGSALDDKGKNKEAEQVYNDALKLFPYNYLLHFNLGLTLMRLERYKEAEKEFIESSTLNPFHPGSQYYLGQVNEYMNRPMEAILCYFMSGLLRPAYTKNAAQLEKFLNGESELKASENEIPYEENEKNANLDEILTLVKSKIATNSKFKTEAEIENIIVKQGQLIFDKLKYKPQSDNYYNNYHIRFFSSLAKEGHLEAFFFYFFSGYENTYIQKWIKNNDKKIRKMSDLAVDILKDLRKFHFINPEFVKNPVVYEYGNTSNLQNYGRFSDKEEKIRTGPWVLVHSNGAFEGKLNFENGKREGACSFYDLDNNLETEIEFRHDIIDGYSRSYNRNGNKVKEYTVKDGKANGPWKEYYTTGQLYQEGNMVDGDIDGEVKGYYPSGKIRFDRFYKKGRFDGKSKLYYSNSRLQYDLNYTEGMLDGEYTKYYSNGNFENKGIYSKDKYTGEWKSYHRNGKLQKITFYDKDGNPIGSSKEYNAKGKLSFISTFRKEGNESDNMGFNNDSILLYKYWMKDGKFTKYEFYSLDGKVISKGEESKKVLDLKSVDPDQTLRKEGKFLKGLRDGQWNYYNAVGFKTSTEVYREGQQEGPEFLYYNDSSIKSESHYTAGELDGYYRHYHPNGKPGTEGWYKNGLKEGEWHFYYVDGSLKERAYFIHGERKGYQGYYNPGGGRDYDEYYDQDYFQGATFFDSTGKVYDSLELKTGNGNFERHLINGQVLSTGKYVSGLLEDTVRVYYPGQKSCYNACYSFGLLNGKQKHFRSDGRLSKEMEYNMGNLDGHYTVYDETGKPAYETDYEDGQMDGKCIWYFYNHKRETVAEYEEGTRHGTVEYFSPEGTVLYTAECVNGCYKTVTGLDHNGKKTVFPLSSGYTKINTYYPGGSTAATMEFLNGYREGSTKYHFPNGKLMETSTIHNGVFSGDLISYYPNGKMRSYIPYYYDEENGIVKYYYENGNLKSEENYVTGLIHGVCHYYNENGKPAMTRTYYYGNLIVETP